MPDIIEFMKHYTPLISILTFLAGLYIGNRQAIGRDRRKEFNEAAEPVIEYFYLVSSWYEKNAFTSALPLPDAAISKLKRRMSTRDEHTFAVLITRYKDRYAALSRAKEIAPALCADALSAAREISKFIRLR